jgi:hypothetical protein
MPDRSEKYRKAAAQCLELARTTSDLSTRADLLLMAQKWLKLAMANASSGRRLNAALEDYNQEQMTSLAQQ